MAAVVAVAGTRAAAAFLFCLFILCVSVLFILYCAVMFFARSLFCFFVYCAVMYLVSHSRYMLRCFQVQPAFVLSFSCFCDFCVNVSDAFMFFVIDNESSTIREGRRD